MTKGKLSIMSPELYAELMSPELSPELSSAGLERRHSRDPGFPYPAGDLEKFHGTDFANMGRFRHGKANPLSYSHLSLQIGRTRPSHRNLDNHV